MNALLSATPRYTEERPGHARPWRGGLFTLILLALLWPPLAGCKPRAPGTSLPTAAVEGINRGVSLMGQYQYDEAVKAFEAVLQIVPDLTEAQVNLAIARFNRNLKEQRDLEIGQQLLNTILQREPDHVRALYFKGIILQHLGQTQPAIDLFQRVVDLRPADGVAWYLLGLCKQRANQRADRELARAIELRPYLGSAYYKLWQSLQMEGRTNEAAPYLEKFKQLRENPLVETIELPQYNQMGDLALVLPLPATVQPPITPAEFQPGPTSLLLTGPQFTTLGADPSSAGGIAAADVNGDGRPDLLLASQPAGSPARLHLLLSKGPSQYVNAPPSPALANAPAPTTAAFGDIDNDGRPDLAVGTATGIRLLRGETNASFTEVTGRGGIPPDTAPVLSLLLLDADHDGDLDLLAGTAAGNQLWNNNTDGTFTNIAAAAGILCQDGPATAALPADLDGDRDADLVLLSATHPARVFLNELLGAYREVDPGYSARGERGGVLQDFNADGRPDLATLGGSPATPLLGLGDGQGKFHPDPGFEACARAAASWGPLRGLRAADLDLDGDLDLILLADTAHALLNDGRGRFVLRTAIWPAPTHSPAGQELLDVTGDFIPDLLRADPQAGVTLIPGSLTPPPTGLAIAPTGVRSRDKRTRSPASGYGTTLTLRSGLREQRRLHTGLNGGPCQSDLPSVLGLGGARQADYLQLLWPDGVAQSENALPAGQIHTLAELQRKISSCPVLFAWNGTRFECITDFAGVGGLGYLAAPRDYAPPRPLEHLKLEPRQLQPRHGRYELRITEPMEESAYLDRLELVALDHPAVTQVYPDERLAVTGPPPTQELLVVDQAIFPANATAPHGAPCTEALRRVDRRYAYAPTLDRRFFGFCHPHTLELDFAGQLASIQPTQRVVLFLSGYLEYPYSQTVYAASQAKVGWQPIRIDRKQPDGSWTTVIPDAGAFGGMARTMTIEVTGLIHGPDLKLRLTSNLELYYDQAFLAPLAPSDKVRRQTVPLLEATLRRVGFAREYSPDGGEPLLYDYHLSDATAPFHVLRGAYTRYGPVEDLLQAFDDRYAILGPGDEVAVAFDAAALSPPPPGHLRSFILVSHAWCKDMDLYTGTPRTLAPLPFQGMSRYPYAEPERYPDTEAHRRYREFYNTRLQE